MSSLFERFGITEEMIREAVASGDRHLMQQLDLLLNHPYYSFQPLPDRPERGSEQSSFVNDKFQGISVVLGGNRSGKSYCAAYKVINFLLSTPAPAWMTDFIVCSEDSHMTGNLWRRYLSQFLPTAKIQNIEWLSRKDQNPTSIILHPNNQHRNWVIRFKSYQQGNESFRSYKAGGYWADEPCPEDVWQELQMRCVDWNFPGSRIYTLTPINCYLPQIEKIYHNRENHPQWKFYHFNLLENKHIPESSIKEIESTIPDSERGTRLFGYFSKPEGVLYTEYNPEVHVIDAKPIPKHWKKYRSIDFGTKHPTVCLWIACDPATNCYYVYDEWYTTKPMLIEDKVKAIKEKQPWDERDPTYQFTLADSEDAVSRLEFSNRGLHTVPADKGPNSVFDGIERVNSLLKVREGETKIKIFRHCEMLRRQMANCRWAEGPSRGRNPGKYKPEPYKMDDDAADALRYFIFKMHHTITKSWAPVEIPKKQTGVSYGSRK